jgi:hypothetical protein
MRRAKTAAIRMKPTTTRTASADHLGLRPPDAGAASSSADSFGDSRVRQRYA